MMAAALIVGIYLQPEWAARLAGYVPSALWIGIVICIAAVGLFGWRLRQQLTKTS